MDQKKIILESCAMPTGITVSRRNKIIFEKWLDGELELNDGIDKQYVIFKAAYDIGKKLYGVPISSKTVQQYINEFTFVGNGKYSFSKKTNKIHKI